LARKVRSFEMANDGSDIRNEVAEEAYQNSNDIGVKTC
jgi:hypothetical protein